MNHVNLPEEILLTIRSASKKSLAQVLVVVNKTVQVAIGLLENAAIENDLAVNGAVGSAELCAPAS